MRFFHSVISFISPNVNAFKFLKSISKTALGCPAAANIEPKFSKFLSIYALVFIRDYIARNVDYIPELDEMKKVINISK